MYILILHHRFYYGKKTSIAKQMELFTNINIYLVWFLSEYSSANSLPLNLYKNTGGGFFKSFSDNSNKDSTEISLYYSCFIVFIKLIFCKGNEYKMHNHVLKANNFF